MSKVSSTDLAGLRAKAALYDELVEQLAEAETRLEQVLRSGGRRDGIDPEWRQIANALAEAVRPYTLFREQQIKEGRIVVEPTVPGPTLRKAREALDRLGRQVAVESYRSAGIPVSRWPATPTSAPSHAPRDRSARCGFATASPTPGRCST